MSYSSTTDFLALLRSTAGGVRTEQMPGLDYVVAALARAGLITLSVGQTAPTSNQSTTVWFVPAVPSWTGEGVVFLWNSSLNEYQTATPVLWSDLISGPFVSLIPAAGNAAPLVDGIASVGVSLLYSRQDHVHPTDTSRAALASPVFTGAPQAPTAALGDNSTNLATTAFVIANGGLPPPIGSILPFAGATPPNANWQIAIGQLLSRTGATANLFSAIGILYGAGDGVTTFAVPDMRGRVVAGVDGGANRLTTATMSSNALGGVGGVETSVLTAAQVPSITSSGSASGSVTPAAGGFFVVTSGSMSAATGNITGGGLFAFFSSAAPTISSATFSGTASVTSNNTGTTAVARVQPTIELNYLIRIS